MGQPLTGDAADVEALEVRLLVDGVATRWGFDLRSWSRPLIARRIRRFVADAGLESVSALQARVLHEPAWRDRLLAALTRERRALFADPAFWLLFRRDVAPILRTYPQLRFWVPCCSTGADVWSLAIVLAEVGLYARSRILATDMNEPVVRLAERGRFPTARPRGVPLDPEEALRRAGGDTLAPWASVDGDAVVVASALRQNIVFARHTILHEDSPNAFHLILAPRALRRFGATARGRVHDQLWRSLVPFGWLAVGSHDRLGRLAAERGYRVVDAEHGVLRRNG